MPDRIGQQLGNYQLLRLLGEGGFAEVYLGEHIHLSTQAAIKVLHTQLTSDDVDKFRTEARTIARLIHPHIVRVLEFGIEGKTPFLVMDYAPNGTLRQRHPKGVALPLPLIVAYVNQVADALQYAHDEKLIHRDVKPENMLLGRRNEILLSDFGIALVAQSSRYQSAQEMAGTMAYIAPEQIQGKPRQASDQYSLGIVVYEWLTGDRPFHGSLTELVGQHLSVPPPSLLEMVETISPEVDRVVLTALAKDPRLRFESIQTFADALGAAAQLSPSTGMLSPTIDAPLIAPSTAPEPVVQLPSDPKSEAVVHDLTHTEAARIEPAPQRADVSRSIQHSIETLHSSRQDPPQDTVPSSPQKRRPSRRFSLLMGGALGLLSLLVVLVVTLGPIMPITRQHVPLTASTHPDHVAQKWVFTTGDRASSPTVQSGVLYVGSDKMYAIDASTGQQKWAFSTAGPSVSSSPTVVNGVVYVSIEYGKVYAIDASTGQQKWVFIAGTDMLSDSPTVVNGMVYVGSFGFDKNVYAIDANTGQQKWAFSTGNWETPLWTVVNGVLYVGCAGNKVCAIDASNGQQKWTFTTGGTVSSGTVVSTVSSPMVVNGVLYISSDDGKVYAIDASTGQQKWAFSICNGRWTPSQNVVNGVLYIGCDGDKMYALDTNTGQQKWDLSICNSRWTPSQNVVNGVLYIVCSNGRGYAIDASTGQQKWAVPADSWVHYSPTVVNGVLYVGCAGNKVCAVDANTGQQKWAFPTGSEISSSPIVVVNGVLYVGCQGHKVYALMLPAL